MAYETAHDRDLREAREERAAEKAKAERAAAKAANAETPEEKAAKEISKDEKVREGINTELIAAQSKVNDIQGQLDVIDAKVNADAYAAMTEDERNESARSAKKAEAAALRGDAASL